MDNFSGRIINICSGVTKTKNMAYVQCYTLQSNYSRVTVFELKF